MANRPTYGPLGSAWVGDTSSYAIATNQLAVSADGLVYWNQTLGADQEAYVTLSAINPNASEIDLLLKGQDSGGCNLLEVWYQPSHGTVEVWTCDYEHGWQQQGSAISVTFQAGDQFGARARADGTVEVYRNGTLLGSVTVGTNWAYRTSGGAIGVWLAGTTSTMLDDFGGGTLSASGTATPTSTPTATSTPTTTPTATSSADTSTATPTTTLTPPPTATPTSTPVTVSSTRVISYAYDGLLRLTGVVESPGTTYAYAYDDAGNRTGVWLNGTRVVTQTYTAANQVVGWSYDNAGNLTNDGTASYTYDALGRMTGRGSTTYTYNGDGALVFDGATRYTQDLESPLTQVLQTTQGSATTNYLYGVDRLAAQFGSARTWYVGDALGSVRMTLDDAGMPLGAVNYDPWGTVESGTVPTFGFTGELQQGRAVYLRARWYNPTNGRFPAARWRTDESNDLVPLSHHVYVYGLNNPVLYTDSFGTCSGPGCEQASPSISTITYDWWLVLQHANTIIDAAKRHERSGDGFSWEVIAALMATTIAREQRLERKVVDAITTPFQGPDGSIGLANTRPSRVVDILNGDYKNGKHSEYNAYHLNDHSLW